MPINEEVHIGFVEFDCAGKKREAEFISIDAGACGLKRINGTAKFDFRLDGKVLIRIGASETRLCLPAKRSFYAFIRDQLLKKLFGLTILLFACGNATGDDRGRCDAES